MPMYRETSFQCLLSMIDMRATKSSEQRRCSRYHTAQTQTKQPSNGKCVCWRQAGFQANMSLYERLGHTGLNNGIHIAATKCETVLPETETQPTRLNRTQFCMSIIVCAESFVKSAQAEIGTIVPRSPQVDRSATTWWRNGIGSVQREVASKRM